MLSSRKKRVFYDNEISKYFKKDQIQKDFKSSNQTPNESPNQSSNQSSNQNIKNFKNIKTIKNSHQNSKDIKTIQTYQNNEQVNQNGKSLFDNIRVINNVTTLFDYETSKKNEKVSISNRNTIIGNISPIDLSGKANRIKTRSKSTNEDRNHSNDDEYPVVFTYLLDTGMAIHKSKFKAFNMAFKNHNSKAILLLSKNPKKPVVNEQILELAIYYNDNEIVQILLSNISKALKIEEIFAIACEKNYEDIVANCLEENVNINYYDDYALRVATYNSNLNMINILLNNGANINCYNNYPIKVAMSQYDLKLSNYLLKKGADFNEVENALSIAKDCENMKSIFFLLELQLDYLIKTLTKVF